MQQKRSRIRPSFTAAPARWWRNIIVPTLPVLACFLGGATEKWSEGIIIGLVGVILIFDPPRFSLGRLFNYVLLACLACVATAFLPAQWFLHPLWRVAMETDFQINLPGSLSPQPWVSLECLISFLAAVGWLYYVSALDLELREVRQQFRLFVAAVVLLAALCIILHWTGTALAFWHNERGFGPFPNRNQTANLFALTAVILLPCGQDDIRHSRKRWVAWLLGFAILVAAILLDFSRAGVLLLVGGSFLWLGIFVLRQISAPRIALSLSILLMMLTVTLVFGGETLERFHLRGSTGGEIAADLRWAIFRDTWQLIRSSPWCGVGIGNFDGVFAIFRDASLNGSRTLHPESDWLWAWAESGWPILLLVPTGIVLLIVRVFPLQIGTNQRFRLAALIAVVLFVLHGIIDVSGHRVGTAFCSTYLLGMGLLRPAELASLRWSRWLFRLLGLALFIGSATWIVAARYEIPLPGAVGAEIELGKATAAIQGRNFKEAIQHTTHGLEWAPLKWQLYFSRALAEIGAKHPPSDALSDFRRARFLEPNARDVPYEEGTAWLATQPSFALAAWEESLRRSGPDKAEIYGHMVSLATQYNPTVRRGLEQMAIDQPDLILIYLRTTSGNALSAAIHRFLSHDPRLLTLSDDEKANFFAIWAERGDLNELAEQVQNRPDWLPYAWRALAKYHSSRSDFRSAYETVRRFAKPPILPDVTMDIALEQLEQKFRAMPYDSAIGYQVYRAQVRDRKLDDALMTLRHFTESANCPPYFYFLEADAWAAKGNWERAWKIWQKSQTTVAK
jgi:O-antigen ligase